MPWKFTLEQARFLLWWYSVEPSGRFTYRDGVFQRLKGHGKDPLGACLSGGEMLGPVRVVDWVDGQTVNVTLRDGMTWHDGQPVTADDVIFSFQAPAGEMSGSSPEAEAVTRSAGCRPSPNAAARSATAASRVFEDGPRLEPVEPAAS